jgi:hypothetical protein
MPARPSPASSSPITRKPSASAFSAAKATMAAMDSSWPASWSKRAAPFAFCCCAIPRSFAAMRRPCFRTCCGRSSPLNVAPLIVRDASGLDSSDAAEIFAADVIVDAILGTGFRPPVSPLYAAAIGKMNALRLQLLPSIFPQGADADAMRPESAADSSSQRPPATEPAPMPS